MGPRGVVWGEKTEYKKSRETVPLKGGANVPYIVSNIGLKMSLTEWLSLLSTLVTNVWWQRLFRRAPNTFPNPFRNLCI